MATVKVYAISIWKVQQAVSRKLGYDFRVADLPVRVMVASTSIMIGAVLRVLFLKNVVTDAELETLFTAVADADYPQLPHSPPQVPEDDSEIPPPDLGT
jgi:hypothetical protein